MAKKSVLPTNVGKGTGHREISVVKGNGVTAVKTLAGCVWRPRVNAIDQLSKNNIWICTHGGFVAFGSSRGTFMPPKTDLVFHDAPMASETVLNVFHVESSTTKPTIDLSHSNRPFALIIEDWVSDSEDESDGKPMPTQKAPSFLYTSEHVKTLRTSVKPVEHPTPAENLRKDILKMTHPQSKKHVVPTAVLTRSRLVPFNAARPVTTVVPQTNVKHQRPAKYVVNTLHSPIRRPINHRPSPKNSNFHQKVTTIKAKQVNVVQGANGNWIQVSHGLGPQKILTFLFDVQGNLQQALKDKRVIDSGCSRHMTGNISYLSYFEEINGGYVAFGGNPKVGKITGKDTECVVLSSDFKLPDENHVLLRVPRENNMYNVDLKIIVSLGYLTCLFAKATLDESNLWHRRLGHINFKTMNKLVKGINREFCVARTPQQNRVAKRNNRTLIEAARTMLVDSLLPIPFWAEAINTACYVQNRNIDADADAACDDKETEHEVYVSPSSGDKTKKHDENAKREAKGKSHVNAASTLVTVVGPNSTNTNSFNAAGPSDNVVSLNFKISGKSSFVDPSQYPDDLDMPSTQRS
uniref:Uncharacterized protein n=1 Tax=Tanacetum cinerariifolium TaxID=118510 RepID=A0A699IHC3_TANCI|nr:hypothetical protein [Tanacetum cinerariifolium]